MSFFPVIYLSNNFKQKVLLVEDQWVAFYLLKQIMVMYRWRRRPDGEDGITVYYSRSRPSYIDIGGFWYSPASIRRHGMATVSWLAVEVPCLCINISVPDKTLTHKLMVC